MRKVLVLTLCTLLLVLLALVAGLYWAMQNQYGAQIVNYLFQRYADHPITVSSAQYSYPNQLSLENIKVSELQQTPINIEKAELWIDLPSLLSNNISFDHVLVSGISLQHGLPKWSGFKGMTLKQLSVSHLDYSNNNLIVRDTSFQVANPIFSSQQIIPFGNIQFSAEQIYWQGEAFDNILLDADYKAKGSTVYGLSFTWRDGHFSGQAEQYKEGWSLVNVTINQLRLNQESVEQAKKVNWRLFTNHIVNINSLDLLDSTIELPEVQLTNANVSFENIAIPFEAWQQSQAYISLNAESIGYLDQLWLDPVFELYLDSNLLTLEQASVEFKQGVIQASGEFKPESMLFSNLSLSGLKWINEDNQTMDLFSSYLNHINQLKIDNLKVKHTQVIQLADQPNWQVSGLNIDGRDLELIRDGEGALWNGQLTASTNNASYGQIYSSHPTLSMSNIDTHWQLNDLFIPLENGLFEATGAYQISKVSRPWQLSASAYGFPSRLYQEWLDLPIQIEGMTDFQLDLSGLAADKLSFGYGLTGELAGSLRDSVLITNESESEVIEQAIKFSDFYVHADRGRVVIKQQPTTGDSISGFLSGQYDFIDKKRNNIQLEVNKKCATTQYDLLNSTRRTIKTCQ